MQQQSAAKVPPPEDMPKYSGNFCFFGADGAYNNGVVLAAAMWVAFSALNFPGKVPKVVVESLSVIQGTLTGTARKASSTALKPDKANAERLTDVFRCLTRLESVSRCNDSESSLAAKTNRALDPVSVTEACILMVGAEAATLRAVINSYNAKVFGDKDMMFTGKADTRVQNLGTMTAESRQKILQYLGKVGWGSSECTWSLKIFDMQARRKSNLCHVVIVIRLCCMSVSLLVTWEALYVGKCCKQTSHAEHRKILTTTLRAQTAFIEWMQDDHRNGVSPDEAARVMQKIIVAAHIYDNVLTVARVAVSERDAWWQSVLHESRMDGFFDSFVSGLMSELDQYARQMIPSVRLLLEETSITMASMAPVDLSDLEQKKLEILSDTYCSELQNDMAVYKHFRQGHMDTLAKWSTAKVKHEQRCKDNDWNAASAFLSKYLQILQIEADPKKLDSVRNTFVTEAATFMKSAIGDVPEENVAELFVVDLRSQGRLQKKTAEPALTVAMAFPHAVKLVAQPVLCRKRHRKNKRGSDGTTKTVATASSSSGSSSENENEEIAENAADSLATALPATGSRSAKSLSIMQKRQLLSGDMRFLRRTIEVPDQHISSSFTLTMSQMLLGRFTREFEVLVPVKASESQAWMEASVFMKGHLEKVPAAEMFTKISLQAAEKARSERETEQLPMNRVNEGQRAQLGSEAVAKVLEEFMQQLPESIKGVKLYVMCAGNPDWSSGFTRALCSRQSAGKRAPRMAAVVSDSMEHRVQINKIHAVETVLEFFRSDRLQIPQHTRLPAIPPGWENQQPSDESMQRAIGNVRAQLSQHSEITAAGLLQLRSCPEKLGGSARISTAREQFEQLAKALGEAERPGGSGVSGANNTEGTQNQDSGTAPAAEITDKELTLASFEAKYKILGKSESHPKGYSCICATAIGEANASTAASTSGVSVSVWLCNESEAAIKIPKDFEICGLGKMKLVQLNAEGMASAKDRAALRWEFGGSVSEAVNAASLKIAFEKPGTNGLKMQSCGQVFKDLGVNVAKTLRPDFLMWNMRTTVASNRSLSFKPLTDVAGILDEDQKDPAKIRLANAGAFLVAKVDEEVPLPSKVPVSRFIVVPVLQSVQAAVTAALATEASEASQGGREFVLQPVNDSIIFRIFSKQALEIPGKSVVLLSS
ncbi:unnamed protein product [Symbiodinium sp. CCMP2592]|nr:unnamed protein product [Symbiodinium sp. CCMP2592]